MRVLWVAPWFRTLGRAWAGPLRDMGHEVLVISSERHFERQSAGAPEILVTAGPRSAAGCRELVALRRAVARFDPDVVVADEVRDPRLILLGRRRPLVLLVHDAAPHDSSHRKPRRHAFVAAVQHHRASSVVVFSEAVRERLPPGKRARSALVPLTSEMPEETTPPFVPAAGRRDFVLVGRLSDYKNLPVVFQGWERHVASPDYGGDRLRIIGGGVVGVPLPPHVDWLRGAFRFADVAPVVAAAKASLSVYTAGSQSGVQIMSMQVGTASVVSSVGGLAEYLPPDETALDPGDVAGLATRLGRLADPAVAAEAGARAAVHYRERYAAPVSADRIAEVLEGVRAARPTRRRTCSGAES